MKLVRFYLLTMLHNISFFGFCTCLHGQFKPRSGVISLKTDLYTIVDIRNVKLIFFNIKAIIFLSNFCVSSVVYHVIIRILVVCLNLNV